MDIVVAKLGMISALGEQGRYRYKRYKGKTCVWYVADVENDGDFIYCDTGRKNSEGFGGRELEFSLVNGSVVKVKGPWQSNSSSFFEDTGVDLRKKHLTSVVISRGRRQDEFYNTVMQDVVYYDERPMVGSFDRWKEIAKELKVEGPMFYYKRSLGGSATGLVCDE